MAFTAVNLSSLSAPDIVEALDFETIFAAMLADLKAREPSFSALVESDPAYKILEVAAYRELLIRQRVNEAAKAVMLSSAIGADLDQIGANYNVARKLITPADPDAVPPVEAVYEADDDFRARIQLAFEGLSTAGPAGAYQFHALSVTDVKDVGIKSPNPGEVLVSVLSNTGDGTADAALITSVDAVLNDEDVRPLTDQVTVQSATIVPYTINATLTIADGPDAAVVTAAATASAQAYVDARHRVGLQVPLAGIYSALMVAGVEDMTLTQPGADVAVSDEQAGYCTSLTVA